MMKHTNLADKFLLLCKQNYLDKITPANPSNYSKPNYIELIKTANEYFSHGWYSEFSGFLNEEKYLVALWAAHLLIEYGRPDKTILLHSLYTIIDHSEHPLAVDVANEEKAWLNNIDLVVHHSSPPPGSVLS